MRFLTLISLFGLCLSSLSGFSQNSANTVSTNQNFQQVEETKSESHKLFPQRPRNHWELGVAGGFFYVSGDLPTVIPQSLGASLMLRRSLGSIFSVRGQYVYGRARGLSWQPASGVNNNSALNGKLNPAVNYANSQMNPSGIIFHNYSTQIHELSLQGIFSLGNINFYNPAPKFNFYALLGGGGMAYHCRMNQLNANGEMYDYRIILDAMNRESGSNLSQKRTVYKELGNLLDDTYETQSESSTAANKIGNYVVRPTAHIGVGLGIHFNKRMSLNVEQRFGIANDDLLDGQQWQEWGSLTRAFDSYSYSFLTYTYAFTKATEKPVYRVNPLDMTLVEIEKNSKRKSKTVVDAIVDELLVDSDGDGIPDFLDKEPDTPAGAIVNARGETLDSDGDGIPDYLDKEPFSPPGSVVNQFGETISNEKYIVLKENIGGHVTSGTGAYLPTVHFDFNSTAIKADYVPALKHLSDILLANPDLKLKVIGHTDPISTEDYNLKLSETRAAAVANFLTNHFGIEKERIVSEPRGKTDLLISEQMLKDLGGKGKSPQYINRRVEFELFR